MEIDYTPLYATNGLSESDDEKRIVIPGASDLFSSSSIRNQSVWNRLRPIFFTTLISGGLFILVLSFLFLLQAGSRTNKSPVPKVPLETVVFSNYTDFYEAPTAYNNGLWMDLLGPSMGFVAIEHPRQYQLPIGTKSPHLEDTSDVEIFGVSMYHQLHCLIIIRSLYYDAIGNTAALSGSHHSQHGSGTGGSSGNSDQLANLEHAAHCFDYLRQGIMCAGDMSLEGAAESLDGSGKPHVNGMGMEHKCRRWESLQTWMDSKAPPVKSGL